jgi:hypothetical protein
VPPACSSDRMFGACAVVCCTLLMPKRKFAVAALCRSWVLGLEMDGTSVCVCVFPSIASGDCGKLLIDRYPISNYIKLGNISLRHVQRRGHQLCQTV